MNLPDDDPEVIVLKSNLHKAIQDIVSYNDKERVVLLH